MIHPETQSSKDKTIIQHFTSMPDRELVSKLQEGDDDAWRYVFLRSVLPVLKKPSIYSIARDWNLSQMEIFAMLFESMIVKNKLRLFEYRCPLIYWLRFYVEEEVFSFFKKNPLPVSDPETESPLNSEDDREINLEDVEEARVCFTKLWKKNPLRAYVHLLRSKNGLSASAIMDLLVISSESNVNKIYERAIKDMKEFREQLRNGGEND